MFEYEVTLQNVKSALTPDQIDGYQVMRRTLTIKEIEYTNPNDNVARFRFSIEEDKLDEILEFLDLCKIQFVLKRVELDKMPDSHINEI